MDFFILRAQSSQSSLLKYKKFFKNVSFPKIYKKSFFGENIRTFLILGPESPISQNIRRTFWGENAGNFFRVDFLFFKPGLESVSGSPIY